MWCTWPTGYMRLLRKGEMTKEEFEAALTAVLDEPLKPVTYELPAWALKPFLAGDYKFFGLSMEGAQRAREEAEDDQA